MIGSGKNPYQFISVFDCAEAARLAFKAGVPNEAYNLGSLNPPPVRKLLGDLISYAGSKSLLIPTPGWAVKRTLDLLDLVNMPIMDPEQYLIADEDCVLDVSKAGRELGWVPQHRDEDMLIAAYKEYRREEGRPRRRRSRTFPPNRSSPMTIMTRPAAAEPRAVVSAPALAPATIAKPNLLTVEDAKALDVARMTDLFKAHINPGQLHFMKLLGFHKVKVERAEGMFYFDQNGRRILDFFGGFGSLAFGHNHPRILERAAALPGREAARDRDRLHVAIRHRARAQPARLLAGRARHGVPGFVRFGSDGSSDQGRRARRRPEAAEDRLCRELLPREDQGRARRHRRPALSRRVQAHRQHGARALRRHRRDRECVPLRPGDRRDRAGDRAGRRRHHPGAEAEFWQKLRRSATSMA